jgi:hypothetical protein
MACSGCGLDLLSTIRRSIRSDRRRRTKAAGKASQTAIVGTDTGRATLRLRHVVLLLLLPVRTRAQPYITICIVLVVLATSTSVYSRGGKKAETRIVVLHVRPTLGFLKSLHNSQAMIVSPFAALSIVTRNHLVFWWAAFRLAGSRRAQRAPIDDVVTCPFSFS